MGRILVNDGMHVSGIKMMQDAGHEVVTTKIEQDNLMSELPKFNAICVRSATKVRQALIDECSDLKVIGRGGVGLDNIDVDYARSKGIAVENTPAASSRSVAELVFGHLFAIARNLKQNFKEMESSGDTAFKSIKKASAKGFELENKTLGVVGFGRIGQETAKIGLGLGMNVLAADLETRTVELKQKIGNQIITTSITTHTFDEVISQADVISLHVPSAGKPIFGKDEFAKMKDGVIIINAARGGTIDEDALMNALNSGKVAFTGLDVFVGEPSPRKDVLQHEKISCSAHIGASTMQAQEKIGIELAGKIIAALA